MGMRTQDKIVVGFVWCLIAFEGLSFLYLFATELWKENPFLFLLEIPLFIIDVSILCWSYYRATTAQPGNPTYITNINYGEEIEEIKIYARRQSEQKKQRRKKKKRSHEDKTKEIESLNAVSYCFKCDLVKEQRVHHCSICRKCIIRMDHHCPWVGNCVGKYNHKFFILFLFYATTGLLMVAVTISIDYFTGQYYAMLLPSQGYRVWLYIVCVTSYLLALSIGFLFVTQMLTSCQNLTTLQSFTEGIQQRNPWVTESVTENLREIFGYSNWMLPTDPFKGEEKSCYSDMNVVDL